MENILSNIFVWLPEGWPYYALLFSLAFFESIVMVGLLVPGSTLIVFAGFLVAHGKGDLLTIMAVCMSGAFSGDVTSYILGGRTGYQLRNSRLFKKRMILIRKAEWFFASHGGKSLFWGRFTGPLRGMVPFIAGCTHMPFGAFLTYSLISGILWGIAYPGLGFLGAASWQKVQQLTGRLSLLLGSILVLFVLNTYFWKKIFPKVVTHVQRLWPRIVSFREKMLQTSIIRHFAVRHPLLWNFMAKRFCLKRGSGLYLTVGFTLSIFLSGIFFWLSQNIGFLRHIDARTYQLFGQYRHPLADRILILITSLADSPVLLLWTGLLLLWLVLYNRDFSAAILLAGMGGGQVLVFLLKDFYVRTRPLPFIPELQPSSHSFPSAHAFSSLLLAGLLVYFLLGTVRMWSFRLGLIMAASFLTLMIGLSRCYLGVHFFTDVLAGFILAAIWLTFLITALEIRRRYAGEFPWRIGWEVVRISFSLRRLIMFLAFCGALFAFVSYLLNRPGFS